jgi:hypothetical protein
MANGIILAKFVKMIFKLAEVGLKIFPQKFPQVSRAILHVSDELDTIASRYDHALGHGRMLRQPFASFWQARVWNGQALAHFNRRGLVIDADKLKSHDATNLCMALK